MIAPGLLVKLSPPQKGHRSLTSVSQSRHSLQSHARTEANRHALDEVAARQVTVDEERQKEAERQQRDAVASQPALIQ